MCCPSSLMYTRQPIAYYLVCMEACVSPLIAVLVDLDIQEKDVRHVSLEKCLIKCKEKGENILT